MLLSKEAANKLAQLLRERSGLKARPPRLRHLDHSRRMRELDAAIVAIRKGLPHNCCGYCCKTTGFVRVAGVLRCKDCGMDI